MSDLIKSWVESANEPEGNFPLNNLPYGVFSKNGGEPRCCTAIGSYILDLKELDLSLLVNSTSTLREPELNSFMALGSGAWSQVRARLIELLSIDGDGALRHNQHLRDLVFHRHEEVTMHLPFKVAEFTDFFSGRHHAENAGSMFRGKENALNPNWLHIPVAYNGRASTVVISGTNIVRPSGQIKSPKHETPIFSPSRRLDIELEMGAVIGTQSHMGRPVSVAEADEMIFGHVLLNDWSARDIQAWEYQPLGPFQAKAFATSISPWVITKAALEPFRVSTPEREVPLLDYLQEPGPMLYDIELAVTIQPEGADNGTVISRTNYREMYYSAPQQLAHHSSSGCAMNTGDLLGSGTISGPEKSALGSLLEMSWGGKEPITLDTGETRTFIEDGDTLTLSGQALGNGYRIGFGECSGKIIPAPALAEE